MSSTWSLRPSAAGTSRRLPRAAGDGARRIAHESTPCQPSQWPPEHSKKCLRLARTTMQVSTAHLDRQCWLRRSRRQQSLQRERTAEKYGSNKRQQALKQSLSNHSLTQFLRECRAVRLLQFPTHCPTLDSFRRYSVPAPCKLVSRGASLALTNTSRVANASNAPGMQIYGGT